jgi:hypothetical protein
MQESHVRQWLADALCTDPNTMLIEQVRDVSTKHGGLYCVELDYTQDSYDQCCELIMQVVATVKNPRKPRYAGLKLTFAQSPDEMQLLLNYGILKSISTGSSSNSCSTSPPSSSANSNNACGRNSSSSSSSICYSSSSPILSSSSCSISRRPSRGSSSHSSTWKSGRNSTRSTS